MSFITKGKTNWKFLLIVIILAIIVGGGVLLYAKKTEKPYQLSETQRTGTDELKVYKDEKYGFEIQYPKEWYVYYSDGFLCISTFDKNQKEKYYGTDEHKKLGTNYASIFINYSENKTLESWVSSIEGLFNRRPSFVKENFDKKEVTIAGERGYRLFFQGRDNVFEEEQIEIFYIFPKKDGSGIYFFEGKFVDENKKVYNDYANKFDEMMGSFKF